MIEAAESLAELVDINASEKTLASLSPALVRCKAVLTSHFALHRQRHAPHAIRFRGVGRDPATLSMVVDALLERMPAQLRAELEGATLLCPESAGFFLGHALSEKLGRPLAISQTDLRRLPAKSLLAGALKPKNRVIIVNDVAGTGASIDTLRELISERHAFLRGVILFGVVGVEAFRAYCAQHELPAHWLLSAKWRIHSPSLDCPDCALEKPLIPISEFV